MSVKVILSIGEDYPLLFVNDEGAEEEIRWYESAEGAAHGTVVELTDDEWSQFRQARDAYYTWVDRLDERRRA